MLYSSGKESKKGAQRRFGIFQFKLQSFQNQRKGKSPHCTIFYFVEAKTKINLTRYPEFGFWYGFSQLTVILRVQNK